MDTGVQWSSLPAYPKRAGGKWTTEAKKCRAGVVSAPAWGTESSGKSCLCQSVNGEEGSRPVPSLWQGTKGSLTKPLMSPITLWYFPPHLSSIYPPASLSQVPGPASEKGAWLAGQPWVSPASLGFGFPSLKRGGWPGVISWVLRRQCCSGNTGQLPLQWGWEEAKLYLSASAAGGRRGGYGERTARGECPLPSGHCRHMALINLHFNPVKLYK